MHIFRFVEPCNYSAATAAVHTKQTVGRMEQQTALCLLILVVVAMALALVALLFHRVTSSAAAEGDITKPILRQLAAAKEGSDEEVGFSLDYCCLSCMTSYHAMCCAHM